MLDGAERLVVLAAHAQAGEFRAAEDVLAASRGHRPLAERAVQPRRPLARATGAAAAGGLVVVGALSGPGGHVLGGRKYAHVDAALRDDLPQPCAAERQGSGRQLNGTHETGECSPIAWSGRGSRRSLPRAGARAVPSEPPSA